MVIAPDSIIAAHDENCLNARVATLADRLELFRPGPVRIRGERMAIADAGNDRVIISDLETGDVRVMGRHGKGPGEVAELNGMVLAEDGVVVNDFGNGRIEELPFDSTRNDAWTVPFLARSIGWLPVGGVLATPMVRSDTYAVALRNGERTASWLRGEIGSAYPDLASMPPAPHIASDHATGLDNGDVVLFDAQKGILIRFAAGGEVVWVRSIPDAVLAPIVAWALKGEKAFRGSIIPVGNDLSTTDTGQILLVFDIEGLLGLLVEPDGSRAYRILEDSLTRVNHLSSAAKIGECLATVSGNSGLNWYRLVGLPDS